MGEDKTWTFHAWHPHFGTGHGSMNHFFCWRRNDNKQYGCLQPTRFDTFGWCLGVLITDIYSCLRDILNAVYACITWLTWSVCSALWILFLFAVYFFPLTVKLTFIVDHASSFHFVTPRSWTRYRSICYLWFKWSKFGADWLIIWKFIVLRVEMDCFSCSHSLYFLSYWVKLMWYLNVKLDKMPFKPARKSRVILSYKYTYLSFHTLHLILWFLGSSKFQLKINQDNFTYC